ELRQEALRQRGVREVEHTVVNLREAAAAPMELLRQPLAAVDTDLQPKRQPRLQADVHQSEIPIPVIEIQMRAPTLARDQLQALSLPVPAHGKRPAPFYALEDGDQPLADAVARQNLPGAILFPNLPRREVLERPALLVRHHAGMRRQLLRQAFGEWTEVLQQHVVLVQPDLQPFHVADRPQGPAKANAITTRQEPGRACV